MSRRYSKLSGMTIVECDWSVDVRYPGEPRRACPEEFRSASVPKMIPKQLELAKWATRTVGAERTVQDLCPHHASRVGLGQERMPQKRTW